MKRLALFVVALSVSSTGIAQSWAPFAQCGSGDQIRSYSFDQSSLVTDGNSRVVKVHGDYSRVRGAVASRAEIVWALDCQARGFVERSRTEYRANGAVVRRYGASIDAMKIAAGSVPAKLLERIC